MAIFWLLLGVLQPVSGPAIENRLNNLTVLVGIQRSNHFFLGFSLWLLWVALKFNDLYLIIFIFQRVGWLALDSWFLTDKSILLNDYTFFLLLQPFQDFLGKVRNLSLQTLVRYRLYLVSSSWKIWGRRAVLDLFIARSLLGIAYLCLSLFVLAKV